MEESKNHSANMGNFNAYSAVILFSGSKTIIFYNNSMSLSSQLGLYLINLALTPSPSD